MPPIAHPASNFQIDGFYSTFGTVMDVVSRISLVRALYTPDKLNQTISIGRAKEKSRRVIMRFSYIENSGREREYLWYRAKSHMVVIEHINPYFALITGCCVDQSNRAHNICVNFRTRRKKTHKYDIRLPSLAFTVI